VQKRLKNIREVRKGLRSHAILKSIAWLQFIFVQKSNPSNNKNQKPKTIINNTAPSTIFCTLFTHLKIIIMQLQIREGKVQKYIQVQSEYSWNHQSSIMYTNRNSQVHSSVTIKEATWYIDLAKRISSLILLSPLTKPKHK
jgi:hypothetical protein